MGLCNMRFLSFRPYDGILSYLWNPFFVSLQFLDFAPSISDIDRHISKILSHPPETDRSWELCLFFVVEISSKNKWCQALKETSTEYVEKISEGNHDEVSSLMESEIDIVKEIHQFIVEYSEGEELERIDREEDEEESVSYRHTVFLIGCYFFRLNVPSIVSHKFRYSEEKMLSGTQKPKT